MKNGEVHNDLSLNCDVGIQDHSFLTNSGDDNLHPSQRSYWVVFSEESKLKSHDVHSLNSIHNQYKPELLRYTLFTLETKSNKTGTSKVGAISKAQTAQFSKYAGTFS